MNQFGYIQTETETEIYFNDDRLAILPNELTWKEAEEKLLAGIIRYVLMTTGQWEQAKKEIEESLANDAG